jgi:DNA polymerase-3 subunit gamma/tau
MATRMKEIVMSEGIQVSDQALHFIARNAEGGMRDALSLLDQALSFGGGEIELSHILSITGAVSGESLAEGALKIKEKNAAGAMELVHRLVQMGKSPEQYLDDLLIYFRDLLLYKTAPNLEEIQSRVEMDPEFKKLGNLFSSEGLFAIIEKLNGFKKEMKWASHPRILLEMAFIRLCQEESPVEDKKQSHEIQVLTQRIQGLEKRLNEMLASGGISQSQEKSPSPSLGRREVRRSGIQPTVKIPEARVRQVASQVIPAQTKKLISIWPEVLSSIREKSIQVHAWLMDGTPVALSEEGVIIAFKNAIHCETTARDLNRGVIEEVISGIIHRHVGILPIMENQWKHILSSLHPKEEGQHEDEPREKKEEAEDHVKMAYRLFGEDLIDIKD